MMSDPFVNPKDDNCGAKVEAAALALVSYEKELEEVRAAAQTATPSVALGYEHGIMFVLIGVVGLISLAGRKGYGDGAWLFAITSIIVGTMVIWAAAKMAARKEAKLDLYRGKIRELERLIAEKKSWG